MFGEVSVRKRLEQGKVQIGIFMNLGSFVAADIAGRVGFDILILDHEHAPWDYTSSIHAMNAVRGTGAEVWARVPAVDQAYTKRILDSGADGVMFPMVGTREDAERLVSYSRYAPNGIRGFAPTVTRHTGYGYDREEYFRRVDEDLTIIAQIETREGVENAEAIASVPGLDVVFLGPMDLSKSLGHPGDFKNPVVLDAIRTVEAAVKKSGKIMGTLVAVGQDLGEIVDRGYRFIIASADIGALRNGLEADIKRAREVLSASSR